MPSVVEHVNRVRAGVSLLALVLTGGALAQAPAPTPTPPPGAAKPAAEAPKAEEAPKPAPSSIQIKVGDSVSMRFGILLQPQADWSQDAVSGGYAQNMGLRRTRFFVSGQVAKDVYFFYQLENSRLGFASGTTKTISTGFQTLDAVLEWRPAKEFNLWGGLIYVPTSREALKSSSSEFMLDASAYAFTATTALAGTGGRDTGFMARGYFASDHIEYRAGAFQGIRETGSRNPFRFVGRLQFNFFDTEVYNLPAYPGAYLGTKKILALGAAADYQKDYRGITADLFADIPTGFGALNGTATFQRLDGGATLPTQLPRSDIFHVDAGLYFESVKLGPWVRYEQRSFSASDSKDEKRYLGGLNFYVRKHNFNIKAGYGRLVPRTGNKTNQFTIQMQAYYF